MYPRNAATPPRIAIGPVVQISDGAVQSSGVSVVVRAEGGSETAGGGTISYGASSSIVYYAPTQAETNYTAFVVAAYKTGCIPVSQTVITTASDTSGYAGLDWGVMANKTTTNALTGTTVATTQQVDVNTIKTQTVTCAAGVTVLASVGTAATSTAQTGDNYARLGAPAGASISADIAAVQAKTVNLPAAPASTTNITAGTITTVTNLTNAPTAGDLTATMKTSVENAVWDATMASHLTAGTTGASLNGAGSAGDPWTTALPGAYGAGTAGKIVGDNLNAPVGSVPTAIQNADALLDRNMATGTDSGSPTVRTVRQALRFLRNKWSMSGTTLTVTKEDDTTSSWTATVTTDAAAVPIVGNDPA